MYGTRLYIEPTLHILRYAISTQLVGQFVKNPPAYEPVYCIQDEFVFLCGPNNIGSVVKAQSNTVHAE